MQIGEYEVEKIAYFEDKFNISKGVYRGKGLPHFREFKWN